MELAVRAARGDRVAFHAIVEIHSRDLFRLARSLSRSHDDAEDIVQETLVAAYKGIDRFNGRSSLRTWLSRILMRRAAKLWHKNRRQRLDINLDFANDSPGADSGLSTASAATCVDRKLDLSAVLPKLAFDHREILVLREMQGLSYAQIAQTLGIPQGTVESRLHRARAELRRRLGSYEP